MDDNVLHDIDSGSFCLELMGSHSFIQQNFGCYHGKKHEGNEKQKGSKSYARYGGIPESHGEESKGSRATY